MSPSIVEILTNFFKCNPDDGFDVVRLKHHWNNISAQNAKNINDNNGNNVENMLNFVEKARKIKIKGIFSRTAKIRDALIKAVKEYERRLAFGTAQDNKIHDFFEASLEVERTFAKKLKMLTY